MNDRLELVDASVGYGSDLAVRSVSIDLDGGDVAGVIGPNGAGKTTLMRSVLGLMTLQSGSIRVLGRSPQDARADVAYVQQTAAIDANFPVSVRDVALMGRYRKIGWLRRAKKSDRSIVDEALDQVGMSEHSRKQFGALSGGQRQRVLLARAIAQQSKLLLLDEPFNGVDAATVEVCLAVLSAMSNNGVTVLMSTHDLELARRICNKVLLMNKSEIAFGPTDTVMTSTLLATTFEGKSFVHDDHGSTTTTI